MKEIRLYFEGDRRLRPGFRVFLKEMEERAHAKRIEFNPIAAGGSPAQDFLTATHSHPEEAWIIVLLDSDGPADGSLFERWPELRKHRTSVFWMVQLMESWFLADPDALETYYGPRFNRKALKKNPHVEQILKKDVEASLKLATRNTGRVYDRRTAAKTIDAPQILKRIDPVKVREAAPNCERLF